MILLAVVSLLLGIACGAWVLPPEAMPALGVLAEWTLKLLMFSVGVSVGANKLILRHMRENSRTVLVIPVAIIVSSLVGGWLTGLLLGMEANVSMAIASGLGWYSLAGVMVTNLAGAELGAVAFLANVFREIFSFLIIPFVAKRISYYAAIAPAAATSEDTTLPMIMKYTDEKTTVIAVLNGVLCSLAVPVLIEIVFRIF